MFRMIKKYLIYFIIGVSLVACNYSPPIIEVEYESSIPIFQERNFDIEYTIIDENGVSIDFSGSVEIDGDEHDIVISVNSYSDESVEIYFSDEDFWSVKFDYIPVLNENERYEIDEDALEILKDYLFEMGINYKYFVEEARGYYQRYSEFAIASERNKYKYPIYVDSNIDLVDIFYEEYNKGFEELKVNFGSWESWYIYPVITINLYSLVDADKEEYKQKCEEVYNMVKDIVLRIKYNPKGLIKNDVTINLSFYCYDCDDKYFHYIDRGCYDYVVNLQFCESVKFGRIPEFSWY